MPDEFYEALPHHTDFDAMAESRNYVSLPDDWFIGTADIVGSTQHIAEGRYKLVNTVGAAVISAQINGADGVEFPFIFGGDGAAFAFPKSHWQTAAEGLAAVRRWAMEEFGLELRAAMVPMDDVKAAGHNVTVARFQAAPEADYAMFSGGGLAWVEARMKDGEYDIPIAPEGTIPDLTGLSCRWTPMTAQHGTILSLVILPQEQADPAAVLGVLRQVVAMTAHLERGGHPVPAEGPGYAWPPEGLDLEARATHGKRAVFVRKLQLLWETWVALVFFRFKLSVGGFDATHYVKTAGGNADFRKFEDGLKMTLDCDHETIEALQNYLDTAKAAGHISYGMVEQDAAVMTCIVPSITTDDHIHFIDGAAGGYATAAAQIKAERA